MTDERLILPEVRHFTTECVSFQYGAGYIAAEYCGVRRPPAYFPNYWVHGWNIPHTLIDPRFVSGGCDPRVVWTGTAQAAQFLQSHGIEARAIGLPIAYLPVREYQRHKGSLLVMPAHSEEYTRHRWRFREYVESINSIRSDFSDVAVCIHPVCVKKGYWINEFMEAGYSIISGADWRDRNALERIRAMCSQFEFLTTNSCGSQVAYGAAFGAKVSFFGPFAEYEREDFEGKEFFQRHPDILDQLIPLFRENRIRREYPEMFCHPRSARENYQWGQDQIGTNHVLSPKEMRNAFGWNWQNRLVGPILRWTRRAASRSVPPYAKRYLKRWIGN